MNRLLVGMLLTLLFAVLLSGCSERTVKGPGPLWSMDVAVSMALCDAPLSTESAANPYPDRVGPADELAKHALPVAAAPESRPELSRRPARD